MDRKQLIVESNVTAGLFKAFTEQLTTVIGSFKQKQKQEFNLALKHCWKVLNNMEKDGLTDEGYLEQMANIYHDVNAEIKTAILKSLTDIEK